MINFISRFFKKQIKAVFFWIKFKIHAIFFFNAFTVKFWGQPGKIKFQISMHALAMIIDLEKNLADSINLTFFMLRYFVDQ